MTASPSVIRSDEAYTVPEFRRRTDLGDYAWRQLRAELQISVGKKRYVRGCDWLAYLGRQAGDTSED